MRGVLVCMLLGLALSTQLTTDISRRLSGFVEGDFSKSMVSLVSMNMEAGGPLDDLLALLKQIQEEQVKLIRTQDEEQAATQRRCTVDVTTLTSTLRSEQGDLDAYVTEQTNLIEEQKQIAQRVKDDSDALVRNQRAIKEAQERLDAENAGYQKKWDEYNIIITACKEAQRMMQTVHYSGFAQKDSSSFAQVKNNLMEVRQLIEHSKDRTTAMNLFAPIIEGLAQLETTQKREALDQILDLIARLLTILLEAQQAVETAHNDAVKNLNALLQDLLNEQQTLTVSLTGGENRTKEIQARLNELDAILAAANHLVQATQATLHEVQASCEKSAAVYNEQNNSRQQEVDIVERLIEFVTERIQNAPQ